MQYKTNVAVFFCDPYKTHKCNVISMQNLWILNMVVRKVTTRLKKADRQHQNMGQKIFIWWTKPNRLCCIQTQNVAVSFSVTHGDWYNVVEVLEEFIFSKRGLITFCYRRKENRLILILRFAWDYLDRKIFTENELSEVALSFGHFVHLTSQHFISPYAVDR